MMRAAWVASVALASVLSAREANAQSAMEIVVLNDGSTYQGELVEKVPGDHVTIKLATGELKRIEWSNVATARDEGSTRPPSPTTDLPLADNLHGGGDGGALVDWPEPDRAPPPIMASRLSVGLRGGLSPVGYGAVEAEYYPWDENSFTVGLHAAYGPWGALGPTLAELLSIDWPLGSTLQQGLGVGLSESFRTGPTAVAAAGSPSSERFFDADCGHVNWFLTRSLMVHLNIGFSWAVSSGCGFGEACGRFDSPATLTFAGGLVWNFDTSSGDH